MKYLFFSFYGLKKKISTHQNHRIALGLFIRLICRSCWKLGVVYRDYTAHGEQTKQAMWIQVTEETTKAAGSLTVYSK